MNNAQSFKGLSVLFYLFFGSVLLIGIMLLGHEPMYVVYDASLSKSAPMIPGPQVVCSPIGIPGILLSLLGLLGFLTLLIKVSVKRLGNDGIKSEEDKAQPKDNLGSSITEDASFIIPVLFYYLFKRKEKFLRIK